MTPGEFEEESSPPSGRVEFEEDEPVASNLLHTPQLCTSKLSRYPLIERPLGSGVALEALVLKVETPSLKLAREVDPENRHVWAVWPRDHGEDCVLGGPRLHVAESGPYEEPS